MRVLARISTNLKYIAGMAFWLIIFAVLQRYCIFNVVSFVDGLWMENLHDGLVKNVIGKVAFRASNGYGDFGCGDKYIYFASYRHGGEDAKEEFRSLSTLVDVATWKEVEVDDKPSITFTFRDSKREYILLYTSDGTDISAIDL